MKALEIIIGLIFTYFLLSILASILQEIFANFTSLRGKLLLKSAASMLELESKEAQQALIDKFKSSTVYQKYLTNSLVGKTLPSYLTPKQFVTVVKDMLEGEAPATGERSLDAPAGDGGMDLEGVKDKDLRGHLETLKSQMTLNARDITDEFQAEIDKAEQAIATYFDEMMSLTSSWYKRNVQTIIILIGFAIAVGIDADTFAMYRSLSQNSTARQEILQIATDFVDSDRSATYETTPLDSNATQEEIADNLGDLKTKLNTLISEDLEGAATPLGLGWEESDYQDKNIWDWLLKLLGWVVTALAISQGAPFWFDLLKLLTRSGGQGAQQPVTIKVETATKEEK
ncbi:MAG: hypothetical protein JNK77_05445 [Saprospiraceae bacterium]|nr:hypothetical protein [Saprospiraceae bacterium]